VNGVYNGTQGREGIHRISPISVKLIVQTNGKLVVGVKGFHPLIMVMAVALPLLPLALTGLELYNVWAQKVENKKKLTSRGLTVSDVS
jgi:hypothetical protein